MILLTFRHHNLCSHNTFLANTNEAKESFPCRSLVSQLEEVDPRKMKHEEKLAFWINVHNALIMHVNSYSQETLNLMLLFFFLLESVRITNPFVVYCPTGIFGLWDSTE